MQAIFFSQIPPQNPPLSTQKISELMQSNAIVVNSIFRWTTFTIFILVLVWIVTIIFPKVTIRQPVLAKYLKRRKAKEFCWCLFGSLFIFEIINFFAISYSVPRVSDIIAYPATLSAIFLTFYATWQYRKDDIYEMNKPTRKLALDCIYEHMSIFFTAYVVMIVIWSYSIIIVTPTI
jgi:hypothetical protein